MAKRSAQKTIRRRTVQQNVKRAGLLFRCVILGEPVTRVAEDMGVARGTAYDWMRSHEDNSEPLPSIQEQVIDIYRNLAITQKHLKHGITAHGPTTDPETGQVNASSDPGVHLAYISKYHESVPVWEDFMPTVVGLVEGLRGIDASDAAADGANEQIAPAEFKVKGIKHVRVTGNRTLEDS